MNHWYHLTFCEDSEVSPFQRQHLEWRVHTTSFDKLDSDKYVALTQSLASYRLNPGVSSMYSWFSGKWIPPPKWGCFLSKSAIFPLNHERLQTAKTWLITFSGHLGIFQVLEGTFWLFSHHLVNKSIKPPGISKKILVLLKRFHFGFIECLHLCFIFIYWSFLSKLATELSMFPFIWPNPYCFLSLNWKNMLGRFSHTFDLSHSHNQTWKVKIYTGNPAII